MSAPFSFEELLAHIRSLMRRYATVKQAILEHAGIRMDLMGHSVEAHGEKVDLTSREFALLEVFMQNAGRTLTRSYITERIWPGLVDTNLLDVYMSRLRCKLDSGVDTSVFKTVRGVGYQLR